MGQVDLRLQAGDIKDHGLALGQVQRCDNLQRQRATDLTTSADEKRQTSIKIIERIFRIPRRLSVREPNPFGSLGIAVTGNPIELLQQSFPIRSRQCGKHAILRQLSDTPFGSNDRRGVL